MVDKVQKIREEVARIQLYTQSEVLKQVLDFIDEVQKEEIPPKFPIISPKEPPVCAFSTNRYTDEDRKVLCDGCKEECEYAQKEEPVSKSLEKAATKYAQDKYMPVQTSQAFKAGANWQKENLWKPADGDNLPIFDREVIVFTQPYPLEGNEYAVSFAHRPNPNGWDGKSVTTGKVEHYTPKTYGKGGWNIPNIVYWLDIEFPKEIEL